MSVLGVVAVESTAFALLAIALFHLQRRVGLIPFLFLFAVLAAAVPATLGTSALDLGPLGSVSHVQAAIVPVLVGMVLLLHLLRGWRSAQLAAGTILLAGVLTAIFAALAGRVPVFIGNDLLNAGPVAPLLASTVLWLSAVSASGLISGLYKASGRWPAIPTVLATGTLGLAVHAGLVVLLARIGFVLPGSAGLGPIVAPVAVSIPGLLIVGAYTAYRLAGLWPETRRQLVSGDPIGADTRLADALSHQSLQEQAEEAKERERDTYRQLVEADERGAYVCDSSGRITYANQSLGQILERPDRDLVGENVRHLFGQPDPQGRPTFARYPVAPGTHRTTITLPDGHERAIEVTVRPTGEGRLHGRVSDRTEEVLRKELEEQKQLAEFYVELLRHDIGNYVMTPLNYLSLVNRREDLPEDVEQKLEASKAAVEEIADLLRRVDVLSDVGDIRPETVDAAAIARNVGDRVRRKHRGHVGIEYDLPDGPVHVRGSPLLEEVFVNLVGNAIRHAGADANLVLGAENEGDGWILRVDDDGPGVPDEDKDQIFEQFTRDESAGGKGLGLYIVRTIVNALDGDVWVQDRSPEDDETGASFRIRLPAPSDEPTDVYTPTEPETATDPATDGTAGTAASA